MGILNSPEIVLLLIIGGMLLAILSGRVSYDLIAIVVLLVLYFSGLVTDEQALSGFSSPIVITLMGLFILTQALEETGFVRRIAARISALGGGSERRLIILLMLAGAFLSLFMNNVAAGAVLLPAAVRVAQMARVRVSKILMPMAAGIMLGGMATYLTTANIVMSGLLEKQGLDGLGMLDFMPIGGLITLAGIAYMLLVGRRLLPDRETIVRELASDNLPETYQLDERLWELRVLPESQLVNMTLRETGIGERFGVTVLAIWHGRKAIFNPDPGTLLRPNDFILVLGRRERIDQLARLDLQFREEGAHSLKLDYSVELAEVLIPPRSGQVGQSLTQSRFRQRFGLTAVALWREGRSYRTDVGKFALEVGDALLVVGTPDKIKRLAKERDYLLPAVSDDYFVPRENRMRVALLITLGVLGLSLFEVFPLPLLGLLGAALMLLTRSMPMSEAYSSIEWRVIFLVAGMLPLSIALTETGLAERIGMGMVNALNSYHPLVLIGGMFTITMLVTQLIGSQVTALILGPIAITAAQQTGISPQAMAVAVSIACSTSFLTPISHPVNILMMGPGGYKFGDFFRVGIGMTLVVMVVLLIGMYVLWEVR